MGSMFVAALFYFCGWDLLVNNDKRTWFDAVGGLACYFNGSVFVAAGWWDLIRP